LSCEPPQAWKNKECREKNQSCSYDNKDSSREIHCVLGHTEQSQYVKPNFARLVFRSRLLFIGAILGLHFWRVNFRGEFMFIRDHLSERGCVEDQPQQRCISNRTEISMTGGLILTAASGLRHRCAPAKASECARSVPLPTKLLARCFRG
jgi:hypothetical protein